MLAAVIASRTPKLLADVKHSDIVTEPYAHYTQTDVVPAPLYQELAAEFPTLATIVNERSDIGSNEAVRMTVKQVLTDRRICAAVARVLRVSHLGGLLARRDAPVRRPLPPRVSRAGGSRRAGVRGLARGAARLCRRGGGAAGLPVRHEHAGQAQEQRQDRAYRPVRQDLLRAVLHARSARPERGRRSRHLRLAARAALREASRADPRCRGGEDRALSGERLPVLRQLAASRCMASARATRRTCRAATSTSSRSCR